MLRSCCSLQQSKLTLFLMLVLPENLFSSNCLAIMSWRLFLDRLELIHTTKFCMQDMLIKEMAPFKGFWRLEGNLIGMSRQCYLGQILSSMITFSRIQGNFDFGLIDGGSYIAIMNIYSRDIGWLQWRVWGWSSISISFDLWWVFKRFLHHTTDVLCLLFCTYFVRSERII